LRGPLRLITLNFDNCPSVGRSSPFFMDVFGKTGGWHWAEYPPDASHPFFRSLSAQAEQSRIFRCCAPYPGAAPSAAQVSVPVSALRQRIRWLLLFFMVGLVLSGLTAFPLVWEASRLRTSG
jgi:hypothetical protein